MLTEFGKYMRIYRLQHGLLLKDMADALDVPPSYISAMEMGRKAVSKNIVDKIIDIFCLSTKEVAELEEAVAKSVTTVKINLANAGNEQKDLVLMFARRFDSLNDEEIRKIKELMK